MKKIISFCVITLVMLVGTQQISAQNTIAQRTELNALAKKKTLKIRSSIKMDSKKTEEIYLVFQRYERLKSAGVSANDKTAKVETIDKAKDFLTTKLKSILNEDEYETYKALKLE